MLENKKPLGIEDIRRWLRDAFKRWASEYARAFRNSNADFIDAYKQSEISRHPKLILAWIAGIAATLVTGASSALLLVWAGVEPKASSMGIFVAAIAIGFRTGSRVADALVKPSSDQRSFAGALHEKAMLRGITAGALGLTLLTIPLDLLSLPFTWLGDIAYAVWLFVALALAVAYGNFIYSYTKWKADRNRQGQ